MVTNVLFYFLHAILCPERTILLKQSSISDFAIVAKDGLFRPSIMTSPQLICDVMWHHIRQLFLHVQIGAEVISLVNNNHEYRFLTTQHSQFSV